MRMYSRSSIPVGRSSLPRARARARARSDEYEIPRLPERVNEELNYFSLREADTLATKPVAKRVHQPTT